MSKCVELAKMWNALGLGVTAIGTVSPRSRRRGERPTAFRIFANSTHLDKPRYFHGQCGVWSGFDMKNIFFSDRVSNKIHFAQGLSSEPE